MNPLSHFSVLSHRSSERLSCSKSDRCGYSLRPDQCFCPRHQWLLISLEWSALIYEKNESENVGTVGGIQRKKKKLIVELLSPSHHSYLSGVEVRMDRSRGNNMITALI